MAMLKSGDWQNRFALNLVENSAVATFVVDKSGRVIVWNKACEHLTGISCSEMKGTCNAWKAFYPKKRPVLAEYIMNGKAKSIKSQYESITKSMFHENGLQSSGWYENLNGKTRYITFDAVPIYDDRGRLIAALETLQDITHKKEAEERNELSLRRLAALHNIDMAITSSFDVRVSIKIILSEIKNQLKVDAAAFLLYNHLTHELEYVDGRGFNTEALKYTHLKLGEGHAGRCALNKERIRIKDLHINKDAFSRSPLLEREHFIEYFAIPLISRGHVTGVMEIFHRSSLNPDQEWLDFMQALATQSAIAIDNAEMFRKLERSNTELVLAYDNTLEGWSRAMDWRDKETEGHSKRVTEMTVKVARAMGISDEQLVNIRRGALLHDIGKLGVPDKILFKAGPLTTEEMDLMKKHTEIAYEILSPIEFLSSSIDIPYCHHEWYDGTGYPRGLKKEQIPLAARIFAVIDVYDALRSDRPYRRKWSQNKTLNYIKKQSGTQFDPNVVDEFMSLLSVISY